MNATGLAKSISGWLASRALQLQRPEIERFRSCRQAKDRMSQFCRCAPVRAIQQFEKLSYDRFDLGPVA